MKTLTKIISTFALAGLAFLPSCGTKAKQEAEKLEQKIEIYDKLTQSYEEITNATKKLEANTALAECREDIINAMTFQKKYFEDEKMYMQTLLLINSYNDGVAADAHNADLTNLSQITRYLSKVNGYNQALRSRLDALKKVMPEPGSQNQESINSGFESVIKKSKEYKSFFESIEKFAKEDASYMAAIVQYSKAKADKESEKVCKLAGAIKANRELLYSTASECRENLERSTKKLQQSFAGCVSDLLPEKKEDTAKAQEF